LFLGVFLVTRRLRIHPDSPQHRLLAKLADIITEDDVLVFATDSGYTLGCAVGSKAGVEKIRQIRSLDKNHQFTLMCRDLSEMAVYAKVSNPVFRLLRAHTPGPYTFILDATKDVPKRLQQPKRKTIGLRIPENQVAQDLLRILDKPLLTVSLYSVEHEGDDLYTLYEQLDNLSCDVSFVLDCGEMPLCPTSIVDLTSGHPVIVRVGSGDLSAFE